MASALSHIIRVTNKHNAKLHHVGFLYILTLYKLGLVGYIKYTFSDGLFHESFKKSAFVLEFVSLYECRVSVLRKNTLRTNIIDPCNTSVPPSCFI